VKWGAATISRDIVMIDHRLDGEIRDGRHHLAVRIYYEDTDCAGIVYHASFIRFMERGRTNYLRLLGADQRGLVEAVEREAPGFGFVVRSMTLDFLKPAHMDDILNVFTEPLDVRGASILLRQTVMRGEEVLVDGQVRVAFVSRGRPRPIPKSLRITIKADQDATTLAPVS
jgi:acyl-CoA thioester hydrolase